MKENEFKKLYKNASCTVRPWKFLIPEEKRTEILQIVRQECLQIYGTDFETCLKLEICTGEKCIGRPLEWKSPTAKPYILEFAKLHGLKEDEEYFIKNCNECPIQKTCSSTCFQVDNFLNRMKVKEPVIYYKNDMEKVAENIQEINETETVLISNLDIPWDCLNESRRNIVKTYMYEHKDFKFVAAKCGLSNQARAKYEFYAALNKLSKVAAYRDFISTTTSILTHKQGRVLKELFIDNLTLLTVASNMGVTKQAVQAIVSKLTKRYGIKWKKFVTRRNNKLTYIVPGVVK